MENKYLIKAGKIVAPHGIRGGLKIYSYLENAADFGKYKSFIVDGQLQELALNFVKENVAVVHFKNVTKREMAEALVNKEVYLDKNLLPQPKQDEFFYGDLIGMKVINRENGQEIGEVASVDNFGAGDVIEIKFNSDGKKQMFAFTKKTFPKIDVSKKHIVAELPEIEFAEESK